MNIEQIKQKLNGRKIGVVIPCHNYGRFLYRCLESIVTQSIVPDRVVIVDDASEDNTKEIAMRYVEQWPDVFSYMRVEFRHANKTRNAGIQSIPDCDFLLLFDPDNYMLPTMIQKMVGTLLENPKAAYAYSDRMMINEEGTILRRTAFPDYDARIFETTNFVDFASMMHRKVYDSVGGLTEDDFFSALEDWDFFYNAANYQMYGIHIPEILYNYTLHKNSKSTFLSEHPLEFQKIKRRILERNYIGVNKTDTLPSVSIVFAARNELEAKRTVDVFSKQRYRGFVEFCYSTQGTIPQAINQALSMAKNQIIVFVETDVKPQNPDWLRNLIYDLTPGSMVFSDEVSHVWYNWAGTAVYKDDLGGLQLDENYPIAEDTEYFERLKKERKLSMIRSRAVVYHVKEHETEKALERAEQYGYLHAKLIEQYNYYPLDQYIHRLELQKRIAEETLKGIKRYQDGQNTLR